jgi:hypothetical protein
MALASIPTVVPAVIGSPSYSYGYGYGSVLGGCDVGGYAAGSPTLSLPYMIQRGLFAPNLPVQYHLTTTITTKQTCSSLKPIGLGVRGRLGAADTDVRESHTFAHRPTSLA